MSKFFKQVAAAAVLGATLLGANPAHAGAMLGQEPDTSLIVRTGDYEWVYASPCGGGDISCSDVQRHHGFDFATEDQWNQSFANLDALVNAFVVNGEARCAASYFSVEYDNCEIWDMLYGYVWGAPFGNGFGDWSAETFLVRAAAPAEVPEPSGLALAAMGLAGVAAGRRKRT